jgi:hypothetical protein
MVGLHGYGTRSRFKRFSNQKEVADPRSMTDVVVLQLVERPIRSFVVADVVEGDVVVVAAAAVELSTSFASEI